MLIKKYKHLAEITTTNRHDQSQVLFTHQLKYCLPLRQLLQFHLMHGSTHSFIMVLGVMSMMLSLLPLCCVDAAGYSYTRFVGPVAGPEHKIFVNAAKDGKTQNRVSGDALRLDYVGKPEYEFAYGVEDADAHVLHNRNEMRDGDTVKGVYSLIDPDGTLRVVKYTADEINGFRAEVISNEVPSLHGQLQHDYNRAPTPPNTIIYNHDDYYNSNDGQQQHHYPQSQLHLKGDSIAYHPSSNGHKPNLEQLPQNNRARPQQPHIIYHYNKRYNDDADSDDNDSSNESDSVYHEEKQPYYEVHEKPDDESQEIQDQRPQYKVHEKPDEILEDEAYDGDVKSGIYLKSAALKKKKHHRHTDHDDDDDDDDDDDYYGEDDSDEVDDFGEAVRYAHNSEESNEYY